MPWQLSTYTDLAFDSLTGTEYPVVIDCALNSQTGERLSLLELIAHTNKLEKQMNSQSVLPDSHIQHIRDTLRQVGIDWNATTARLAHYNWVTPEYIRTHATAVDPRHIGLAINRMLAAEPPPQELLLARYPHIRR